MFLKNLTFYVCIYINIYIYIYTYITHEYIYMNTCTFPSIDK